MPAVHLTLIGAGSAFAFYVVSDLLRTPALAGSSLTLVDIDAEALDWSYRITQRMISQAGGDLALNATTDRRSALPGSDYVLITISVGEPWARERDVAIGEEYGIYQPTSQTVGPAGYARGLRVIPQVVEIGHDIASLCPEAIVLDLANPLSPVCRALIRECDLTVIGLCEQWAISLPPLAAASSIPIEQLEVIPAGLNHLTFATGMRRHGSDVMQQVLSAVIVAPATGLPDPFPVSRQVYEAFGIWPLGTEEHVAEFFPYFLTRETNGGADYGMRIRHTSPQDWEARRVERAQRADGTMSVDDLLRPSGESAVAIIGALSGAMPPGWFVVNIPNGGRIGNLPPEAIVELPAWVKPGGALGRIIGELPEPLAHFLRGRTLQHELMVDAALSGDRDTALRGLLLDPQVPSLMAAREILARSLEANSEHLPRFAR